PRPDRSRVARVIDSFTSRGEVSSCDFDVVRRARGRDLLGVWVGNEGRLRGGTFQQAVRPIRRHALPRRRFRDGVWKTVSPPFDRGELAIGRLGGFSVEPPEPFP